MGNVMKAPIRYFGGKGGMLTPLLSYFPDPSLYDTYVDAYGGAGTVLLAKPLTKVEIFNDLNRNVYTLFKVLVDPTLFDEFRRRAELALYDESTSQEYRQALRSDALSEADRAFYFWYVARTKRAGGGGGFIVNPTVRRRMSKSTSDFLASVEGLLSLHERLSSVVVRNCDALDLIKRCDYPRTFIYLDPPYVQSTRTETRYETDADDMHHEHLIAVLNDIRRAYVVLSGYDHTVYDGLHGYHKHQFQVNTVTSTNVPKVKTETVWCNFEPVMLPMFAAVQP
jgi:DNA adenine methylase